MRVKAGHVGLWASFLALSIAGTPMVMENSPAQSQPVPVPAAHQETDEADSALGEQVKAHQAHSLSPKIQAPKTIRQGEVLRVEATGLPPGSQVTLAGRSAPFFQQPNGSMLALVAVSVYQNPGTYPLVVSAGGQAVHQTEINIQDGKYRRQNISVSKGTAGLQPLPGEMEAIQRLKDTTSPVRFWEEPFTTPTPDCQNSPFGVKRYHNGKSTGDYHKGVDLRSPAGRPIRAIASGKVQIVRMYRLHGGTVGIDHGQGIGSIYIHMSKISVKPGDVLKKGDLIGHVGSTGFATGPHLHWGLYVNGLPVNPNQWIKGVPACG